jgi:AcrR family transcriptional regulator
MKQEVDSTTEQKILETAERLFKEKGFALTTTVEIAKAAGCNQALVHYYFRSKEKLFANVFEKIAQLFLSTFFQIDEQDLPFEVRLKMKIESHYDVLAANPRLPFFFFNEISTNPERLNTIREKIKSLPRQLLKKLQDDLDTEYAKGAIRKLDATDMLMTVISLNIMPFMAKPLIQTITSISDDDYQKLILHRKEENVNIILRSIRP